MKVFEKIKHELLSAFPAMVFFFVSFCLLILTRRLILQEYNISFTGFANAVFGALIVGKVVLILDNFRFMNRFPGKPLIYNVLWKSGMYLVATLLFRYLEHLIPILSQVQNFQDANRHLIEMVVWPHFWLIQMWLSILFFIFTAFRELIRAIGKEKFTAIFFGRPDQA